MNRAFAYKELGKAKEMCEDYWTIRYDPYTGGQRLYQEEGCAKLLQRELEPPPEEIIRIEETSSEQ